MGTRPKRLGCVQPGGCGAGGVGEKEKLTPKIWSVAAGLGTQRQTEGREGRGLEPDAGRAGRGKGPGVGTRDHRAPFAPQWVRGTKPQPQLPGDRKGTKLRAPREATSTSPPRPRARPQPT